jgi:hypothetical protein
MQGTSLVLMAQLWWGPHHMWGPAIQRHHCWAMAARLDIATGATPSFEPGVPGECLWARVKQASKQSKQIGIVFPETRYTPGPGT